MSFFRNLRSSITRGRSSSRDTTPVRNSRPSSVISSLNSGSGKRRDSIESRNDSLFNRSETFILDEPDETPCHSNCSTLEKKSKKSKVLEKFSTFTKRKKTPTNDSAAFEHHPSDNATNTYYKWQADGVNSLDYDSQNDPFNFLYEQQSSLKSLQNSSSSPGDSLKSNSTLMAPTSFDSSTYRKSKMPADLKKQLKNLKDPEVTNKEIEVKKLKDHQALAEEEVEEDEDEALKTDKYKTITLNSFRKSFREKFLQQQKDAAYNPAWFVEVEPSEISKNKREQRESSKENRRDLLVFENDNYRPGSRSPIRDLSNRKTTRSPTRSPVKRNETFKIDRLSRLEQMNLKKKEDSEPAIRIEFKNSITPHIPGRMVPVGVAKPMPSQLNNTNYYHKTESNPLNTSYTIKSSMGNTTTTRLNNHSPIRSPWIKEQTPVRIIGHNNKPSSGKYQTLVQIKNEERKPPQNSPITVRNSRLSTRIQLVNNGPTNLERKSNITTLSPSFGKRYNSAHLLTQNNSVKSPPLRQTYFGDGSPLSRISTSSPLSSSTSALKTRTVGIPSYGGYKYHTPSSSSASSTLFSSATTLTPSSSSSTRTTPSYSVNNIHSSSNNNLSYLKHYQQQQQQQQHQPSQQQHQSRIIVAQQRRSRSPIKIPWR